MYRSSITVDDESYPVAEAVMRFHRDPDGEGRLYLLIGGGLNPDEDGLLIDGLSTEFHEIEDLHGRRIHLREGVPCADDTMGTFEQDVLDCVGWSLRDQVFFPERLLLDFERLEANRFRCRVKCDLYVPDDTLPQGFETHAGTADVIVAANVPPDAV